MSAASGRWEFCGDGQPHERHEFIRGALRCGCPGSPSATSRLASGAEVPDVPVRAARSAATASRHRPLIIEHEPTGPILYEAGCRCGWKAPSLFLTDADAERAGWDHEDECEEAESNG